MKKILSLTLVFMLLFCTSVFSKSEEISFENLKKYNIMQTESNLTKKVTRAEIAQIAVNASGLSDVDANLNSIEGFQDVDSTHAGYNAIGIAQSVGIINGRGDGTYAPDDNVTYEQVFKIAVVLLGYEPLALAKGGYPSGYLSVAESIGLTDEIEFKNTDEPTRYDIALIIEKAFSIPIMEQISYGENAQYAVFDGKGEYELVTLKRNFE